MRFIVMDDGEGFDYHPSMREMPDPMKSSGRGLYLMTELMDHVDVRTSQAGTTIALERRAEARVAC